MKYILFFNLFFLNVFGCEITPNRTYLKLGKTFYPPLDKTISKDCKESELNDFYEQLTPLEGNIPTAYLFDSMTNKNINFTKESISILDLQQSLNLSGQDFSFQNAVFSYAGKIGDNFNLTKVECNNCDQPGKKTFKVIIKTEDKQKEIWVTSLFQKKITYFKVKDNIFDIDTPLAESNFIKAELYTSDPQSYFTDFDKIKFYRVATKITKDMSLKNDLIVKKYLVKQGNSVDVLFKNELLSITNRGQAMSNGKYGETIRVRTTNKKELSGIIKDFNQVEVQL